jgi:hypothetical protein
VSQQRLDVASIRGDPLPWRPAITRRDPAVIVGTRGFGPVGGCASGVLQAVGDLLPFEFGHVQFVEQPVDLFVRVSSVGLEYTIGTVTCVFSYQREVVMRRSGIRG